MTDKEYLRELDSVREDVGSVIEQLLGIATQLDEELAEDAGIQGAERRKIEERRDGLDSYIDNLTWLKDEMSEEAEG